MSFVTDTLTPIIIIAVGTIFSLLIIYILWKNVIKPLKKKFFKPKPTPEDVQWCYDAYQLGWDAPEIRKFCLKKGVSPKKTEEQIDLFERIKKELKGGLNGRQETQRNVNESIPEIQEKA